MANDKSSRIRKSFPFSQEPSTASNSERQSRIRKSPFYKPQASETSSIESKPPDVRSGDGFKKEKDDSSIDFPGWLAIDFGTSNSTVTLFDPGMIAPPTGLPQEQENKLRHILKRWLEPGFWVGSHGVSESNWQDFVAGVNRALKLAGKGQLQEIVANGKSFELQEALRQIELSLVLYQSEAFRRGISSQLYSLYHTVFREPPLQWQGLTPSILDLDTEAREIPSELEIVESGSPLTVKMGYRAKRDRLQAMSDPKVDLDTIRKKFLHSPKRYLGQNQKIDVVLANEPHQIEAQDLIQAAWNRLIELTDSYRQLGNEQLSEGRFQTAVVTYPAVAPPSVRHQVRESLEALGIPDVQTTYDEAISSAMFFLWRELGRDVRIGIEAFKTRCHYDQGKWSQNLLVLDIGGGTTDLALIQLILEEVNPFSPGEDRGLGGRYYVITPKLLGSSGHLHLGGELLTLRIFRVLKVALADCLLTAVSKGTLTSQKLSDSMLLIDERFRDSNDQFLSGTLLASVDTDNVKPGQAYKDALDAAETVLPTRWENASSRLQAFYTLWDKAEEAKLSLGKMPKPEPFLWSTVKVGDLLKQSGINDYEPKDLNDFCRELNSDAFTLTLERFEQAVRPVIREAVEIASGLVNSRKQKIDWLILSGKTCGLDMVSQEVRQVFSESNYFVWNPERVTFVADYAKLATSVGACYIEKLRRFVYAPDRAKDFLRRGFNQLYINVKNLSNFLPSDFKKITLETGQEELIFKANAPLYQLDSEHMGKARSEWLPTSISIDVKREDYKGRAIFWGGFNSSNQITKELAMGDPEFLNEVSVQFEINHQLDIRLFFCRGKPHYRIDTDLPSIDVRKALPGGLRTDKVFSSEGLEWDILVDADIAAAAQVVGGETILFTVSSTCDDTFHYQAQTGSEPTIGKGVISQILEPFPKSGEHKVYARHRDTQDMQLLGDFSEPTNETEYPCLYCISLDENGILRFHSGEVPYWNSDQKEVLKNKAGCVYQADLERQPPKPEKDRDPFTGIH